MAEWLGYWICNLMFPGQTRHSVLTGFLLIASNSILVCLPVNCGLKHFFFSFIMFSS